MFTRTSKAGKKGWFIGGVTTVILLVCTGCKEPPGPSTYTLSVTKSGTGSGMVTGAGIACGTECSETVARGTSIALSAAPAAGSTFLSWTGCDTPNGTTCSVLMTADKTLTATFSAAPVTYTLAVTKSGTGSGTVTGPGISCGADCSETVSSGTLMALTAAPTTGSSFVSWTGCDAPSGTTCSMSMTANKTLTATFNAGQQSVTFKPQYDNVVEINSQDSRVANTVIQTGPLYVDCNWIYDAFLNIQDFVCAQSLMRFDLSSLAGKTIINATLTLTVDQIGIGSSDWHVRALASSWSPTTVTWSIADKLSYYIASPIVLNPPSYAGQVLNIDLTQYVKNWANQTWINDGIIFGSENYTFPYATLLGVFQFYSLEDPGKAWPVLTVTYQ
jgi:List-Bact-rpt repeat protein